MLCCIPKLRTTFFYKRQPFVSIMCDIACVGKKTTRNVWKKECFSVSDTENFVFQWLFISISRFFSIKTFSRIKIVRYFRLYSNDKINCIWFLFSVQASDDNNPNYYVTLGKSSDFETVIWRFPNTKQCPLKECKLSCSSRSVAFAHFHMHHAEISMICTICDELFLVLNPLNLLRHCQIEHPNERPPKLKAVSGFIEICVVVLAMWHPIVLRTIGFIKNAFFSFPKI